MNLNNQIVMDKLSIRTTDYFSSVWIDDVSLLDDICNMVRGMVMVGPRVKSETLKEVKNVKSIKTLDEGVFDKVLANYHDKLKFGQLIRIADNFSIVTVLGVPKVGLETIISYLEQKGIFEIWSTDCGENVDLIFRVRKYK